MKQWARRGSRNPTLVQVEALYALPDDTAQLKPGHGPGYEAAQNNCAACHSVEYINTQPPGRGVAFWQAEVTKMTKVYRAQISEEDTRIIAEYLAQAY